MAGVGRAGEHDKIAVDFSREKNSVAVEGQEGVVQPGEGFEILSFGQTDGCAVKVGAPHDIIRVFHLDQTRVIGIAWHEGLAVFIHKLNLVFVKIPVNAVLAAAKVNKRNAVRLLAAEHADKSSFIRNDGGVENARYAGDRIAVDDGVFAVAPERAVGYFAAGFVLPGHFFRNGRENLILGHSFSPFL